MLRDRQEKEQLVRKFEEFFPQLKGVRNFGWFVPYCDKDPVYHVHPEYSEPDKISFRKFWVNLKTGEHSDFIYRDEKGIHRIRAGKADVFTGDWSDYCYRAGCVCKEQN